MLPTVTTRMKMRRSSLYSTIPKAKMGVWDPSMTMIQIMTMIWLTPIIYRCPNMNTWCLINLILAPKECLWMVPIAKNTYQTRHTKWMNQKTMKKCLTTLTANQYPEKQKPKECRMMTAKLKECWMTSKPKECRNRKKKMMESFLTIWTDDAFSDREATC